MTVILSSGWLIFSPKNELWQRTVTSILVALPVIGALLGSKTEANGPGEALVKDYRSVDCGIWLAPSSLEGAGLGMYAGQDYKEGDELLPHSGDIVIPLIDVNEHNAATLQAQGQVEPYSKMLWDEYTWEAEAFHMNLDGWVEVNVASPGFGSAANSLLPLQNVQQGLPDQDPARLHRSQDPGAGAVSYYWNRQSYAHRDISSGEELFVNYGEEWFTGRPKLGPVPLTETLNEATRLFQRFRSLQRKLAYNQALSMNIFMEMWNVFVRGTPYMASSRVLAAFHHHDDQELERLINSTLTELRIEQSRRSHEWLTQHGTCGDHLYGALSTIPQAGRGAFATRDLPRGTVVALLPLIHVLERERLRMYPLSKDDESGLYYPDPSKAASQPQYQLLLNYCFGHSESSLLLCPYGPMANYMNHAPTRPNETGSHPPSFLANVELQWADPARSNHQPDLFTLPWSEWASVQSAQLALELVATRDLAAGEEVFLDYGESWQDAWDRHVATWQPLDGAEGFTSAWHLNHDLSRPLKTAKEQETEPYPLNTDIRCDIWVLQRTEWGDVYDGIKDYHDSVEMEAWRTYLAAQRGSWEKCSIMDRYLSSDASTYLYSLQLLVPDHAAGESNQGWQEHQVENVPREFIHFVDRPYTSDLFLENAFRHELGIPDAMFPEAWRNLRSLSYR